MNSWATHKRYRFANRVLTYRGLANGLLGPTGPAGPLRGWALLESRSAAGWLPPGVGIRHRMPVELPPPPPAT